MTETTTTAGPIGRPPLVRFRADLVLCVELGAVDEADAEERLAGLLEELKPRFASAVRNGSGRRGNPRLIPDATYALEPSEV